MGLSNTAVPRYYRKFRDDVLMGKTPVCENVSLEMNRIDALIANPGVYYDDSKVEGWIDFCESEMTLTDGSDVHMLDSFKLWGEQLLGWYYFVDRSIYEPYADGRGGRYVNRRTKRQLTKKQYIIVGRGGAKTLYDSFIQAYYLNVDRSTTQQITTAPTMNQADEVLAAIRTAITRSKGPLYEFLTAGSLQNTTGSKANRQKLASTKIGVQNFMTNSTLKVLPMTIDKLQGQRTKCATVDEWLSCDINADPTNAIEQGCTKYDDYVIVATSSEGTIRNRAGDSMKMELSSILRGEYLNPHVSIWWYRLDNINEVAIPSMWVKANPNIGITVSYEAYQLEVERMEHNPSIRNDTLAKRFGIPTEGYTVFFTYEEIQPHRPREYWQMACSMGCDLSQGDDFCAFTFLFPLRDGKFGIKSRSYISELTLKKLQPAMREKYDEFIAEGTLIVMPGSILDMMDVYEDLTAHIDNMQYDVNCIGYDPYNAKAFVTRWELEHGPFGIVKVIQGARTESVPLGELKKLAEDRRLLFDESLMTFAMGNCITIEDTNGNRKLLKKRHEDKIDNVAAMMDAFVAYKLNKEAFE